MFLLIKLMNTSGRSQNYGLRINEDSLFRKLLYDKNHTFNDLLSFLQPHRVAHNKGAIASFLIKPTRAYRVLDVILSIDKYSINVNPFTNELRIRMFLCAQIIWLLALLR